MDTIDISAIIIDDDPEAINLLEMFLRHFPKIKIVGKTTNAINGLELINEIYPDLVFLDIDMPDMTGLQVAESVKNENIHSEIVFTTAYQDYAYRALNIEPLDFLTKPFCQEDLEIVIKKYIAKAEKKRYTQKLDKFIQSQLNLPKINLPTTRGILIIEINDIVYAKANSFQSILYLQDGTVETVTKSLNNLILMLNSSLLFQVNRATFVNLNYLLRIDKKKKSCILRYNSKVHEESMTKNNIANFEKLNIYPIV